MKNVLWFVCAVSTGVLLASLIFYKKTSVIVSLPSPSPFTSDFDLNDPPSLALKGQATVDGEVNWQSRMATQSALITVPQTIQQGESLETMAGLVSLEFANVANLALAAQTHVDIVQTLPANLVFAQTSGQVSYKKLSTFPISVRIMHLLINIEGDVKVTIKNNLVTIVGPVTVAYNNRQNVSQIVSSKKSLVFNDDTRRAVVK